MTRLRKQEVQERKAKKHLAFRLFDGGMSIADIADELNVARTTVGSWRSKWKAERDAERARHEQKNVAPKPYRTGFVWGGGKWFA